MRKKRYAQPGGLGDFLDVTNSTADATFNPDSGAWEPSVFTPTSVTSPSIGTNLTSSISDIFSSLFGTITKPAVVTAGLNKYVFGQSAPIPTATNQPAGYVAPSYPSGTIMGIPTTYLLIGGAAALLFLMKPKRGR